MSLDRATVQEDSEDDCNISAGAKNGVELDELLLRETESVAMSVIQWEVEVGSMPYVRRL